MKEGPIEDGVATDRRGSDLGERGKEGEHAICSWEGRCNRSVVPMPLGHNRPLVWRDVLDAPPIQPWILIEKDRVAITDQAGE
jgi:hypothetical protein